MHAGGEACRSGKGGKRVAIRRGRRQNNAEEINAATGRWDGASDHAAWQEGATQAYHGRPAMEDEEQTRAFLARHAEFGLIFEEKIKRSKNSQ